MPEIKEVSDRVIFLFLGQIVGCDTSENLNGRFGQEDMEEMFVSIAKEPLSIGLVVRFGPSADILAVFIPFLLLPFFGSLLSGICVPFAFAEKQLHPAHQAYVRRHANSYNPGSDSSRQSVMGQHIELSVRFSGISLLPVDAQTCPYQRIPWPTGAGLRRWLCLSNSTGGAGGLCSRSHKRLQ